MIIDLLVAFFIVTLCAAILFCLALGLHSLTQYIEAHASRARRIALRALYLLVPLQLLLSLIDDIPSTPLLPNLAASALHYSALSDPSWPYTSSSSLRSLASLLLLPLTTHIWLVRHHTLTTHAWHQHRYDTQHRPKLPGARLDWDVSSSDPPGAREMTNMQVCAVLAVCVWSIPVVRLLGRIAAAEWGAAGVVAEKRR